MNDDKYVLAKLKAALILDDAKYKSEEGYEKLYHANDILRMIAQIEAEAVLGEDIMEVK